MIHCAALQRCLGDAISGLPFKMTGVSVDSMIGAYFDEFRAFELVQDLLKSDAVQCHMHQPLDIESKPLGLNRPSGFRIKELHVVVRTRRKSGIPNSTLVG